MVMYIQIRRQERKPSIHPSILQTSWNWMMDFELIIVQYCGRKEGGLGGGGGRGGGKGGKGREEVEVEGGGDGLE